MTGPLIRPFAGKQPRIHDSAFIAPGCVIIGDVEIGEDASIWYNCVLRGDVNAIRIGARSNIQDGTVIHCDSDKDGSGGHPTLIGADVLVGHQALLHGCTIDARGFVGMGAIAMDGSRVEGDAMLAAGAMLTPGKCVPTGALWSGRPARHSRMLRDEEIAGMAAGVAHYVALAKTHKD